MTPLSLAGIIDRMKISVVVPVYNEINTIREILRRVQAVGVADEILVVEYVHRQRGGDAEDEPQDSRDQGLLNHDAEQVPVGEALIGRVISALGEPVDGKGPIKPTKAFPVEKRELVFRGLPGSVEPAGFGN